MLLAEDSTGKRMSPVPGGRGGCPFCKSEVIAKCGEIKTWHWAHKSLITCDSWGEPEGDWHYEWKKLAGLNNTEITIEKDGKRHRADIIIDGLVIELQHSPLPVPEVREREEFYGNMIWVLDGETALLERSPDPVERWVSRNDTL
jgi:competence CoiA-like predicted nuclease